MEIKAKCPYCKNDFFFITEPDEKGASTQTCPHCQASIDTQVLLALMAGGYGAPEIKPRLSPHAK